MLYAVACCTAWPHSCEATAAAGLGAVPAGGRAGTVAAGDQQLNGDSGYVDAAETSISLGRIGNLIFSDVNFDGIFGAGDSALAGVSVDLIRDTNENDAWDVGEPIIATVTSDSVLAAGNSNYRFQGIPAGRFLIHVSDTNGSLLDYNQTSQGQPDTDNHSQNDPVSYTHLTLPTSDLA